jgi:hypothetical protein
LPFVVPLSACWVAGNLLYRSFARTLFGRAQSPGDPVAGSQRGHRADQPCCSCQRLGGAGLAWRFFLAALEGAPRFFSCLKNAPISLLRDHQTTHMSYQYCRRLSVPLSTQGNGDTSPPALVRFNCSISRHDVEYQSRASNLFGDELLGGSRSGLETCPERLADGATNSE